MSLHLPPGLVPGRAYLLEDGRRPDFRDLFGHLAQHADMVDTAVTRIRLTTLNLSEAETRTVETFRVLVTDMSALRLDAEARALASLPERAAGLSRMAKLLETGALQIRAAPLAGWSPDFSVFSAEGAAFAVLLGFHSFERPYPHPGPALGSLHLHEGAGIARRRIEGVWARAHDIGPPVWDILSRARGAARRTLSRTG